MCETHASVNLAGYLKRRTLKEMRMSTDTETCDYCGNEINESNQFLDPGLDVCEICMELEADHEIQYG